MSSNIPQNDSANSRLLSLDIFRGITMLLLIGETTYFYEHWLEFTTEGSFLNLLALQFHHHPWNGLRFWDHVQPFFMFIVGVAMPFSFGARWARGDSWNKTLKHALTRSAVLLFLGWALYCIGPGRITFELWNVLAQLSFTYLVAFLIMRKDVKLQIGVSIGLLILTELLFRLWPISGFDQAFTPDKNFGSWVDLLLMGKLSNGHWLAFNAVPSTAHTIWGVLAGLLLKSDRDWRIKLKYFLVAGVIMVIVGYGLNPITPIIKRICTSSFIIVTGGWAILALGFLYWLIDVQKKGKWMFFFAIVGMNPLFIYLFTLTGGADWFMHIVHPFVHGILAFTPETFRLMMESLTVWSMLWGLTYWLYKRKIFIRI
ncbi:MAG: DUF5009 domain-containing protein [Candidatus Marinimicrobia bacterium]|nr:DUF5009 domain-containing protein [Candidatus Neomarinimicrobiota bacterium]MCF7923000.1 DUF5009 domain-containing protein [Candidatus Neomarinimicrobiota bacterium]